MLNLLYVVIYGLFFGLVYTLCDIFILFNVAKRYMELSWDPFTNTTLRISTITIVLCGISGFVLGFVDLLLKKKLITKTPYRISSAITFILLVITLIVSPEWEMFLFLGVITVITAYILSMFLAYLFFNKQKLFLVVASSLLMFFYIVLKYEIPEGSKDLKLEQVTRSTKLPNILWIVFDTTRYDHVLASNSGNNTTPNLQKLANESFLFKKAYSTAPWTLPSHASMFTGLYPSQHLCTHKTLYLDSNHITIAEILKKNGYQTAIFSGNPWLDPSTNITKGFDFINPSWRNYSYGNLMVMGRFEILFNIEGQDKGGNESVLAFNKWFDLQKKGNQPFFAFINFMDAHSPYEQIPNDFKKKYLSSSDSVDSADKAARKYMQKMTFATDYIATPKDRELVLTQYDGGISYVDQKLGQIIEKMKREGLYDDTLIIVNSDHGEMFGENDLYGHDLGLYNALVHVPLVIKMPRSNINLSNSKIENNVYTGNIDEYIQLTELFPTILELLNISNNNSRHSEKSLILKYINAMNVEKNITPIFSELDAGQMKPLLKEITKMGFDPKSFWVKSVLIDGLHLIRFNNGKEMLFDLNSDPLESKNILEQSIENRNVLAKYLDDFISKSYQTKLEKNEVTKPPNLKNGINEMDSFTKEKLKSLGYVQ